jgi:hypothetical protein
MTDVTGVAGQDEVRWPSHQRQRGVDDIRGP